jgi:hypothetical protein
MAALARIANRIAFRASATSPRCQVLAAVDAVAVSAAVRWDTTNRGTRRTVKTARIVTKVEAQVSQEDIRRLQDSRVWKEILESLRYQAGTKAAEAGGHLDATRLPTFVEPQLVTHPIVGGDWWLFAAEWYVVVPEKFDDVEAARRDEILWKE